MKKVKHNKKTRKSYFIKILTLLVVFGTIIVYGNFTIGTTRYKITSNRLPVTFKEYKIAQISDLHNSEFGQGNSKIINILKKENPNIIVITGDLVDSSNTDIDIAIKFIQQAAKIAPCYYVTGNHEAWIGDLYDELEEQLVDADVTVLHDEMITLSNGKDSIQLVGLDDPDFTDRATYVQESILDAKLHNIGLEEGFKLLLSHRPEAYEVYVTQDIDLVLSGHAHGGQFRIPFIGGVIAPNQGFFPKYDAGEYN
ncbi:metallophosphoesterase [Jeotgalibaca sp. PTS2502]|uniref:metallophosphoesterase n=1 Tax=Jeotgalibaca sp. PTS2502 TaxID=1903686 RepID=UPI0018DC4990|nr:metallophosphoesterase [Jeotgalibaca sp. PTS2502]